MSEMLMLYSRGVLIKQIAAIYGLTYSTVYGRIQREIKELEREVHDEREI